MSWIKLPSGKMVNIDAVSYAVPVDFESLNTQKLLLVGTNGNAIAELWKKDAIFLYWYLDYVGEDSHYSGFDTYLEDHKNDMVIK